MISYFRELLNCFWEIEKDLHAIASSMKVQKKTKHLSVVTGEPIKSSKVKNDMETRINLDHLQKD